MSFFDFVKSAGKKLGLVDDEPPVAEAVLKELASHKLGADDVKVVVKGDTVVLPK